VSKEDLTGRGRIVKNVGASYLGHVVFIIFGFILPRVINDTVGQEALGIWDFSWSLVNYLSLSMIGIGSSVNRFVARYRASGDTPALNRTVSTVVAIQLGIAVFVLLATLVIAYYIPVWFAERLAEHAEMTRWVVGLLGTSLAVQMAFDAWRGVLSGCHRWDYYNALNAGGYAIISIAMLVALGYGYGLSGMAAVYLAGTAMTELLRYKLARSVCPELSLDASLINRSDAKKVVTFGAKNVLLGLPGIIVDKTVGILVVIYMGPAALAILSRPLALVRTVGILMAKYANVLVPTAGSLQSQGKMDELREFAVQSSRTGILLSIPPLAYLIVLGDVVLELWMGPDYAYWSISAILATGGLLVTSQGALLRILIGMDLHGRVAKYSAIYTIAFVLIGLAIPTIYGWTLPVAAALTAIPVGLAVGGTILFYGLRQLGIGLMEYCRLVFFDGFLLLTLICAALWAIRTFTTLPTLMTFLLGGAATGAIVLILHAKDFRALYRKVRAA
jgi:O-antigen/teichoic acid export membrane protein